MCYVCAKKFWIEIELHLFCNAYILPGRDCTWDSTYILKTYLLGSKRGVHHFTSLEFTVALFRDENVVCGSVLFCILLHFLWCVRKVKFRGNEKQIGLSYKKLELRLMGEITSLEVWTLNLLIFSNNIYLYKDMVLYNGERTKRRIQNYI
jgi:hypothetical protein